MSHSVSKEIQQQAMKVAKGTQRPGQSKEQTKLIAQGIEKGIAEYKKQQNKKARARDKLRKSASKAQTAKEQSNSAVKKIAEPSELKQANRLPWSLLLLSWLGFAGLYFFNP